MKKFLQNKKGRYTFRRGSRYPSKDFCKCYQLVVQCVCVCVCECRCAVSSEAVEHTISSQLSQKVYTWLYLAKKIFLIIRFFNTITCGLATFIWVFHPNVWLTGASLFANVPPICVLFNATLHHLRASTWPVQPVVCSLCCILTIQQHRLACEFQKKKKVRKWAEGTFVFQAN